MTGLSVDVINHIARYAGAETFLAQGYRYKWVSRMPSTDDRACVIVLGFIVSIDTYTIFAEISISGAGVNAIWVYDETIAHPAWIPTIREEFHRRYQEICSSDAVMTLGLQSWICSDGEAKAIVADLTRPVRIPIVYGCDGVADHASGVADRAGLPRKEPDDHCRPSGIVSAMSRVVWYPAHPFAEDTKSFVVAVRDCFGMSPKLRVRFLPSTDGLASVSICTDRNTMHLSRHTYMNRNISNIQEDLADSIAAMSATYIIVEGPGMSADVQRIICAEIFEMVGRGIFEYSPHRIMVQTLGDAYLPDYAG